MASAVSFLFHIPDVNIKAMKGEKIMNNAFEQYDKNCQRIIFIKVDHFNKILSDAKAGVTILHRNMELHNNYQAYLDNCKNSYEVPLSLDMYEERYFMAKCPSVTKDNKPACASICKALGLKSVAYEWAEDYHGKKLNDELEVRYTV